MIVCLATFEGIGGLPIVALADATELLAGRSIGHETAAWVVSVVATARTVH